MDRFWKYLLVLLGVSALLLIAYFTFGLFTVEVIWVVLTFYYYRYIRQEEILYLLTTAVESGAPLAPAMEAYINDRPRSEAGQFLWMVLVGIILLFGFLVLHPLIMVPLWLFLVSGYYWLWHREHRFDSKVEKVVNYLDGGAMLHEALRRVPGVVSRDAELAAAIGETTGKLGPCLNNVSRWRLASLWVEVVPRLLYPVLLLFIIMGILGFMLIFIIPKHEKIFADFKVQMPWVTEYLINGSRWCVKYAWIFFTALPAMTALFIVSSAVCWHCPILGRIYRLNARGRVLKALGLLLETDMPAPRALGMLAGAPYFGEVVRRRLQGCARAVEQGQPFPEQLQLHGLLPSSMLPLVQSAQRAGNLPWALNELGETLVRNAGHLTQRVTMTFFPISVVLIGLLVGFVALGMFWPLVKLITEFL